MPGLSICTGRACTPWPCQPKLVRQGPGQVLCLLFGASRFRVFAPAARAGPMFSHSGTGHVGLNPYSRHAILKLNKPKQLDRNPEYTQASRKGQEPKPRPRKLLRRQIFGKSLICAAGRRDRACAQAIPTLTQPSLARSGSTPSPGPRVIQVGGWYVQRSTPLTGRPCQVAAGPSAFWRLQGLTGCGSSLRIWTSWCLLLLPGAFRASSCLQMGAAWGQVTQPFATKALKPILVLSGHDAAAQDFRRMTDRYSDVSAGCTYAKLAEARGHKGQKEIPMAEASQATSRDSH